MPAAIASVSSKPARNAAPPPSAKQAAAAGARPAEAKAAASSTVVARNGSPSATPALYNARGQVADKPAAAAVPAKAAAAAPADTAAGGIVAQGGRVSVDILNSDSGYENKIYWSSDNFATRHLLGVDNQTGSVDIGEFAAGTKIDFGIVNGANQFFRTGGAGANADGVNHTNVSGSPGARVIGFEDLAGGGDRDFNDAIIRVRESAPDAAAKPPTAAQLAVRAGDMQRTAGGGPPLPPAAMAPQPAQPPAAAVAPPVTPKAAGSGGNRSGLGDGSNPGQGAGRANSPNTGTLNPNQSATKATAPPPAVATKGKTATAAAAAAPAPAPAPAASPQPAQAAARKPGAAPVAAVASKAGPPAATPLQQQAKEASNKQLLASSYVALAPPSASANANAAQHKAAAKAEVARKI